MHSLKEHELAGGAARSKTAVETASHAVGSEASQAVLAAAHDETVQSSFLESKAVQHPLELETILAPVDFSSRSDAEVEHAVNIAARFGAKVVVQHVMSTFKSMKPTDELAAEAYSREFSDDIRKGIEHALRSLIGRVAPDCDAELVVSDGDPAEKIEELALERNADLIVMPTTGEGRSRRNAIGSVTSKLLSEMKIPILTGAHVDAGSSTAPEPFSRIACLIYAHGGNETIPRWASDFAAAYGAELEALCILPFRDGPGAAPSTPKQMRPDAIESAHEQVEEMLKQQDVQAKVTVLGGKIEKILPSFVNANKIDLVVMGRRSPQKVIGIFGKRDLGDVLQFTRCPTISV